MRVVIIGAGISGLATAWFVRRKDPDCEITVLEREPVLGGTIRSVDADGFLFEAGPNGFLTNKPHTLDLAKAVGAEGSLLPSSDAARRRFIFTDRLHALPESPGAFLSSRLLSAAGKLRVIGEVFIPPRKDEAEESLRDFGYRRVGKAFTDTFLDSMAAGVHASTAELLSVNAAFPAVVRLEREHGGLFRGMLRQRKKGAGPGGVLTSFSGGLGTFITKLSEVLEATLQTDSPVTSILQEGDGYRVLYEGGEIRADRLVIATPAFVAAELLAGMDSDLADRLRSIEYSPIAVVGLGYRRLAHPLPGFGLLTTGSSGEEALGVLWDSSIFPDRAPPGGKSMRVLIGGQRNPDLALRDDDALASIARRAVSRTMGIDDPPAVIYAKRWERGIPHYRLGHLERVAGIEAAASRHPHLFLNSNAYRGVGINDCVANSESCATRVVGDR